MIKYLNSFKLKMLTIQSLTVFDLTLNNQCSSKINSKNNTLHLALSMSWLVECSLILLCNCIKYYVLCLIRLFDTMLKRQYTPHTSK